jgi:adenylyltransferase/sulfurtransferase
MNDDQLLRYSRQIMLPQIGIEGQQRLADSHALILGLGGLGSPLAMYLAAAGVGKLTLVDFDYVDLSNLQRQILHGTDDIGRPKTDSARARLQAINPLIEINTVNARLDEAELRQEICNVNVVLDGSDNFATRFMVNRACMAERKPLVSAAAIRMEGQLGVFRFDNPGAPCYQCLYQDTGEENTSCSENGVLAPVVGVLGSLQALEAIKVLLDLGETLDGKLLVFDAMSMEWRTMNLRKDPNCPACKIL